MLLTVGLLVVAFVLLVVGVVVENTPLLIASIACTVVAGGVLIVFSRVSRRAPAPAGAAAAPAPAGGPSPPPPPPPPPLRPETAAAPAEGAAEREPATARLAVMDREPAEGQTDGGYRPPAPPPPPPPMAAVEEVDEDVDCSIADYDELRVSGILPLLPELDLDEL